MDEQTQVGDHGAAEVALATHDLAEILVGGGDDDLDAVLDQVLQEFLEDEATGTGVEEVLGRSQSDAENGKWFKCSELGEPGSFWRRLPQDAEVCIAKLPNKRFNSLIDSLQRKWRLRHRNEELPAPKVRKALPVIYSHAVLRGLKKWKLFEADDTPIKDTQKNRRWLLERYDPELLNAVDQVAGDLSNFKPSETAAVRPPDV